MDRACLENPEDDTPRLVLADWLDERGEDGDAARAEFIRRSIELDGSPQAWSDAPGDSGRLEDLRDTYGIGRLVGGAPKVGDHSRSFYDIEWSRWFQFPESATLHKPTVNLLLTPTPVWANVRRGMLDGVTVGRRTFNGPTLRRIVRRFPVTQIHIGECFPYWGGSVVMAADPSATRILSRWMFGSAVSVRGQGLVQSHAGHDLTSSVAPAVLESWVEPELRVYNGKAVPWVPGIGLSSGEGVYGSAMAALYALARAAANYARYLAGLPALDRIDWSKFVHRYEGDYAADPNGVPEVSGRFDLFEASHVSVPANPDALLATHGDLGGESGP